MSRHFSMLRDFHLADWFTLANAFCGTGAVFAAMRYLIEGNVRDLLIGMALIPLAFIFDALDGRIARWRKSSSTLGRELDSLADVISFGVAPAALAYACGLQGGWDWMRAQLLRVLRGKPPGALQRHRRTAVGRRRQGEVFRRHAHPHQPGAGGRCWRSPLAVAGSARRSGSDRSSWVHGCCIRWCWCSPLSGSLMISKTLRIPKP